MIKADPGEVEAYKEKVENVKLSYDRISGRLVRVFRITNPLGGQYIVRRLSEAEANELLAKYAETSGKKHISFYAAGHNHGSPGGSLSPVSSLAALVRSLEKTSDGLQHTHYLDTYNELVVQVWGTDESPARAFRSQPPGLLLAYKTRQQRKWEQEKRMHASTTFFPQGPGQFRAVLRPRTDEVPYMYGFTVGL